ncbi:hypothetical protein [Agrobacterium sp.]|uniref:hypothetical protein n=1 Tax=Agrobacterium sp. TaxID=361 RepID=UPI0028AB102E
MQTTVKLSRTYHAGVENKAFDTITLREPTFADTHMSGLGKPQEFQPGPRGTNMLVSYPDVVDAYAQRLIVEPGYEYISRISALDALALERAICSFFLHTEQSGTPPTGSSSNSVSAATTSNE